MTIKELKEHSYKFTEDVYAFKYYCELNDCYHPEKVLTGKERRVKGFSCWASEDGKEWIKVQRIQTLNNQPNYYCHKQSGKNLLCSTCINYCTISGKSIPKLNKRFN